ncbi:DUF4178 domain-containing protein [Massilia pseudoviolaceinigra]|uniref:DUF4178 domain-containing protein n=1 Tax=Massilia pseudoviolaceinigra TaxID=3057165 RepID=UPI0027964184|nr:DUF4178 domain-containing protein [Massilia sp. CCM 9206]MDQ1923839.1 DUF4178 domain-containing protein [Massilia sp. CCM 9206]
MQIVSCPSCGAEVKFKSHAAVMAVCEFCRATLLKDAESVKNLGTMSSVLEDYSPIQIGTTGTVGARNFTVVGRIQLRYAEGMWNEWYVLYGDGGNGWLGDSSGLFTITAERNVAVALPGFDAIHVANAYHIDDQRYLASEKRSGECIAGQGELPFRVGTGWRIRVADFRSGPRFLTLDYTDGETPVVYTGVAVTLAEMRCQLLRDDEQIKASAGKYRGKVDALDCPSCGSTISYLPGVATNLVCPSCAAQLDAAGPEASVLAAGDKVAQMRTTIEIGAKANIHGSKCTVIGAMIRANSSDSQWTEYLVYSVNANFFWLIESDDGWYRADVMTHWPAWHPTASELARADKVDYEKTDDYIATVVAAAGAFNWRVAVGDTVHVMEFAHGKSSLAAEISAAEMTWSRSKPVAADQVTAWFSKAVKKTRPPKVRKRAPASGPTLSGTLGKFFWWLLGLNLIPLLFNFGATAMYLIMALLAICIPAMFTNVAGKDDE